MYIKLGDTKINYTTSYDDYLIFAEVIDTGMSFEKPTIVRTSDELDIWFSNNFYERDYLKELLGTGACLYLYSPISTDNSSIEGYIDYTSYIKLNIFEDSGTLTDSTVDKLEDFKNGDYKFKVKSSSGINYYIYKDKNFEIDNNSKLPEWNGWTLKESDLSNFLILKNRDDIYLLVNKSEKWIWYESSFLNVELLKQNIENTSNSLNNRSTLYITKPDYNIEFTYPEYKDGVNELILSEKSKSLIDLDSLDGIDPNKIDNGYSGSSLRIMIKNTDTITTRYLLFKEPVSENSFLFYCGDIEQLPELTYDYLIEAKTDTSTSAGLTSKEFVGFIANYLSENELTKNNLSVVIDEGRYIISSKKLFTIDNYCKYSMNDFGIKIDKKYTYYQISKKVFSDNSGSIEFWSKTIGRQNSLDSDGDIKIWIENIDDNNYRFTIKRYNTTEIFEGPIKPEIGEQRIDSIISKNSQLVYCNILNITEKFRETTEDNPFVLFGGEILNYTQDDWMYSLDIMLNNQFYSVYPDFLLIDNMKNYVKDFDYETVYKKFLNYSKSLNFQVLIQNSNSSYIINNIPDLVDDLDSETKKYNIQVITANFKKAIKIYIVENYELKEVTLVIGSTGTDENCIYSYNNNYYYKGNIVTIMGNYIYAYSNLIYKLGDYNTSSYSYYVPGDTGFEKETNVNKIQIAETGNEVSLNYLENDNRLLYFYRDMTLNGNSRPGYYAFLRGLLENNYSASYDDIVYNQPTTNPYIKTRIDNYLSKYKSHYLVYNNHRYYYSKNQNGDNYTTTIFLRFIMGKVFRELQKNRGKLFGSREVKVPKNYITSILNRIKSRFTIVNSLFISTYSPNFGNNSLNVIIETNVNDLVDNNVQLNITINYNNNTY